MVENYILSPESVLCLFEVSLKKTNLLSNIVKIPYNPMKLKKIFVKYVDEPFLKIESLFPRIEWIFFD